MKTQKNLIAHYKRNLEKVIASHGVDSEYTNYAFYQLQAVKMNMDLKDIFAYAKRKCEELKEEALSLV